MKINRTLLLLIISDMFILSSFGLIIPIFAIFVKENLLGGSLVAAGLASTIFLVTKSILQLPLSRIVDTHKKKVGFLLCGTALIITVPFIYAFSTHVWHIFLAQVIYGIGAATSYPTWFSLFTAHLDPKHRGFEWALWSTGVGLGTAIAAYLGAKSAGFFGFQTTFFIVGAIALIGFFILFKLETNYSRKISKLFLFKPVSGKTKLLRGHKP